MPFDGEVVHFTEDEDSILRGLKHARGLIERGWTQRSYLEERDGVTHFCILGALHAAVHGEHSDPAGIFEDPDELIRHNPLVRYVEKRARLRRLIYDWNDEQASVEPVIKLLTRVIRARSVEIGEELKYA